MKVSTHAIVGNDDGPMGVPQQAAAEVPRYAQSELDADKHTRRALYESMDRPVYNSVK